LQCQVRQAGALLKLKTDASSGLLRSIISDLRIAVSFATVLPLGPSMPVSDGEVARASWALPVAGLLVGLATRQIWGQTGDILGAFDQIGEIAILLPAAALLQTGPRP
jgi:cobalamin synthase